MGRPGSMGGTAGWGGYDAALASSTDPGATAHQPPPAPPTQSRAEPTPVPEQPIASPAWAEHPSSTSEWSAENPGWREYSDEQVPAPIAPGQLITSATSAAEPDYLDEPVGVPGQPAPDGVQPPTDDEPPAGRSRNRLLLVGLIGLLILALVGGGLALYFNLDRIRGVGDAERQLTLIDKYLPDDAAVTGLHWVGGDAPGDGVLTMSAVLDDSIYELTAADYLAGDWRDQNWQPSASVDPLLQGQTGRDQFDTDFFLAALAGLSCPTTEREVQLQVTPTNAQFLTAGCRGTGNAVRWESIGIDGSTLALPAADASAIEFLLRVAGAIFPKGEVASLNWQPEAGQDQLRFDAVGSAASDTTSPRLILHPDPWTAEPDWWQVTTTLEAQSKTPGVPAEQWLTSDWAAMVDEGMAELNATTLGDVRFHLITTVEYGRCLVMGRSDNEGPTLIFGPDGNRLL